MPRSAPVCFALLVILSLALPLVTATLNGPLQPEGAVTKNEEAQPKKEEERPQPKKEEVKADGKEEVKEGTKLKPVDKKVRTCLPTCTSPHRFHQEASVKKDTTDEAKTDNADKADKKVVVCTF